MAEFLNEAAIFQTAFIIGFVKQIVNRLALCHSLVVLDLAGFGKGCAVNAYKPCHVGAEVGKGSVQFQFLLNCGDEDLFGDENFV